MHAPDNRKGGGLRPVQKKQQLVQGVGGDLEEEGRSSFPRHTSSEPLLTGYGSREHSPVHIGARLRVTIFAGPCIPWCERLDRGAVSRLGQDEIQAHAHMGDARIGCF